MYNAANQQVGRNRKLSSTPGNFLGDKSWTVKEYKTRNWVPRRAAKDETLAEKQQGNERRCFATIPWRVNYSSSSHFTS